jgi:hypothetical protein
MSEGFVWSASGHELLQLICSRLWKEARAHVPIVLEHGADETLHPLDKFILAQKAFDASMFALPEPLLGPIPNKVEVLLIGLNPGYGPEEAIPRLGDDLGTYIDWYSSRFSDGRRDIWGRPASRHVNGTQRLTLHYHAVERDYLDAALGKAALGRRAVYADAIPWKWNNDQNPELSDRRILEYGRRRLVEIAQTLHPTVIIPLGGLAADCLGAPRPADTPVLGQLTLDSWEGKCLPLAHPNKHWKVGIKEAYLEAAQATLLTAI